MPTRKEKVVLQLTQTYRKTVLIYLDVFWHLWITD